MSMNFRQSWYLSDIRRLSTSVRKDTFKFSKVVRVQDLSFIKLRRSKLDTTYLLSTTANVCLPRILPSSWSLVVDDMLLNSLTTHFSILSSRVTFLLTNLVVRMVEVRQPINSPFELWTGN